eukprot:gnl/TRDRNA2_/TRDRNA2_54394_c0_seq1.p1 gnl/TRDRNA2_/TRDRNA2_54394_c0~~gnl/TRDRNA2_/TRDRNA2_54394_c0_seq1.p1  ORF type:complete len:169 (-),score=39.04 gnl/TRDRNA2_/TRDRNA2_54394_c0_seq1:90-596(-)
MAAWKVVGGVAQGGIVARCGVDLASLQLPERLGTGAVVRELTLQGDRLQFSKVSGNGPETGWVSLKFQGKDLVVRLREADADDNCLHDMIQGCWTPSCGNALTIKGTKILWNGGLSSTIELHGSAKLVLSHGNRTFTGELVDGTVKWSDGDTWIRQKPTKKPPVQILD